MVIFRPFFLFMRRYVEADLSILAPASCIVFVCLCDVDLKGVSRNVCDGVLRAEEPKTGKSKSGNAIKEVHPKGENKRPNAGSDYGKRFSP